MHLDRRLGQFQVIGDFLRYDNTTSGAVGVKENIFANIVKNANVTNKTINGYEAMVERRLAKEGKDPASFQLGQRQWGKRIEGTPFVEHNGEMYLEVIFLKPGKSYYELNAQQINPEFIEGLPEKKAEGEQGGLDNKVVIRTFKVSNIAGITINGEHHVL